MKVIVIPPKHKYDCIANHFIEGLYDNGIDVIASDLGNSVRTAYSDDEILEHSKDADFIFYVFGKGLSGKEYLIEQMNKPEITAYIDGSEWTYTGQLDSPTQEKEAKIDPSRHRGTPWIHEKMYNFCRWYFKSACYPEDQERGIIPFSVGCENKYFETYDSFGSYEKQIDVFISFGNMQTGSTGLRKEIVDLFQNGYKNTSCIITGGSGSGGLGYRKGDMKPNDYYKTILQSYIVPSSWGGMLWSMREWEVLASGTLCFMQRPPILYATPKPKDGMHWVEYSDMNEFQEKLDYYISNKDLCVKIGNAGKEHALKYHTSKAKTRYVLDIMKNSK